MKKRIILLPLILLIYLSITIPVSAGRTPALLEDPLADVPEKLEVIIYENIVENWAHFPVNHVMPMKLSVTNSNPDVVNAEVNMNAEADIWGRYEGGIILKDWNPGNTSVTVTLEMDGKTYQKTCDIVCRKEEIIDPLERMPETEEFFFGAKAPAKGCEFITPIFINPVGFQVESSNPEIIDAERYDFDNGTHYGYMLHTKKPGTSTVTVTLDVNGKTYKKSCKYTVHEYTNPFTEIKLGDQSYMDILDDKSYYETEFQDGSICSFKLKPGYELKELTASYEVGSFGAGDYRNGKQMLENGSELPEGTTSVNICVTDLEKNLDMYIWLNHIVEHMP